MDDVQQLPIREIRPLTKSLGFNSAMLLLAMFSFYLLGGVVTLDFGAMAKSSALVAGVGLSGGGQSGEPSVTPEPLNTATTNESNNILPFSSNIVVTEGEDPDSIIVQPIFENGAGRAYEYSIVSTEDHGLRDGE